MGPISVCSSCTGMCRQTRRVKGCDFVRTCISDADCPGLTSCMCDSLARRVWRLVRGRLSHATGSKDVWSEPEIAVTRESDVSFLVFPLPLLTTQPQTNPTPTPPPLKFKKNKYISSCLKLISFHLFPSPLPSLSTHTKNVLCLISVHLLHFSDFC